MAKGPKGSEIRVEQWLRHRPSVTDVRFVGDEGEGPPDFLVRFDGASVAVEVTKMSLQTGWPESHRIAFERALCDVVQVVKSDPKAPRWHVLCEYDPRHPKPPKPKGEWRQYVRDALMMPSGGGRLQLMEAEEQVGDGVVVEYLPAGNDGSLPFVNESGAYFVVGAASERIAEEVRKKAAKVRSSPRARELQAQWWLILEDEVVLVHSGLHDGEWQSIRESVAAIDDIEIWSKVVLVSARTCDWTTVYEREGEGQLT